MTDSPCILTDEIRQAIRAYFPRYPTRQAVVLPALHEVDARLGYVPPEAVAEVAQILDLTPAQVQDTLSFYEFFAQEKPHGRTRIWVCRSISCAARDGQAMLDYLCQKLGIRPGETTPDGRVTVSFAECLGLCDFAPAMLVNDTVYKNLTRETIDAFVESLKRNDEARMTNDERNPNSK